MYKGLIMKKLFLSLVLAGIMVGGVEAGVSCSRMSNVDDNPDSVVFDQVESREHVSRHGPMIERLISCVFRPIVSCLSFPVGNGLGLSCSQPAIIVEIVPEFLYVFCEQFPLALNEGFEKVIDSIIKVIDTIILAYMNENRPDVGFDQMTKEERESCLGGLSKDECLFLDEYVRDKLGSQTFESRFVENSDS